MDSCLHCRLKVTLNVNLAGFIYQLDTMVEHLLS